MEVIKLSQASNDYEILRLDLKIISMDCSVIVIAVDIIETKFALKQTLPQCSFIIIIEMSYLFI